MRLEWLTSFVRVVDRGQISSAADELHISQSALSRQMSAVEADFGTPLLIRGPRGVELTPAGRLLYRRATQLLHHVDELHELVEAESRATSLVRVGVPPGMPTTWLRQHVLAYADELVLNEWTTNEQLDFLRRDNLDVAITHERSTSLPSRLILVQRLGVALPAGSPVADRIGDDGTVYIGELDGMRLLAHSASAVRSSEGVLRSLSSEAGVRIDWVFRRFSQYLDIIADAAGADGAVTTAEHGIEAPGWSWYPLSAQSVGSDDLAVRTWVNWKSDASSSTRRFVESLPTAPTHESP